MVVSTVGAGVTMLCGTQPARQPDLARAGYLHGTSVLERTSYRLEVERRNWAVNPVDGHTSGSVSH